MINRFPNYIDLKPEPGLLAASHNHSVQVDSMEYTHDGNELQFLSPHGGEQIGTRPERLKWPSPNY